MVDWLRRHVAFVVLLVLAIAAGGWLYAVVTRDEPEVTVPLVREDGSYRLGSLTSEADEEAVKAAVDVLPVALSYDYRSLDKSLDKATSGMTSSFADEFTEDAVYYCGPWASRCRADRLGSPA